MKYKLIAASVAWFICCVNAHAQPLVRMYGLDGSNQSSASNPLPIAQPALPLAQGTSTNVTVTTASQTVSLNGYSQVVTINNTSTNQTLYFNPFGGAASTSNFPINAGQAYTWQAATPLQPKAGINQFTLYATGSTVVGILAH